MPTNDLFNERLSHYFKIYKDGTVVNSALISGLWENKVVLVEFYV